MQTRFVITQQLENRGRILRWLANFVVLCQNDVICELHSPKTMEFILVVVISADMAENSQNGVSRSLTFFRSRINTKRTPVIGIGVMQMW